MTVASVAARPRSKTRPAVPSPAERCLLLGARALTDPELLSVLLAGGGPIDDPGHLEKARQLYREVAKLRGLPRLEARDILDRFDDERATATLLAAIDLGRRLAKRRVPTRPLEDHSRLVSYLKLEYARLDQEIFGVVYLDWNYRWLTSREIARGSMIGVTTEPRTILREALRLGAARFSAFHTHPAGLSTPSPKDREFTRQLAAAGELMGVPLVEHLVIDPEGQWERILP